MIDQGHEFAHTDWSARSLQSSSHTAVSVDNAPMIAAAVTAQHHRPTGGTGTRQHHTQSPPLSRCSRRLRSSLLRTCSRASTCCCCHGSRRSHDDDDVIVSLRTSPGTGPYQASVEAACVHIETRTRTCVTVNVAL